MGNQSSSLGSYANLLPSSKLKWKSGNEIFAIPCPPDIIKALSFDKLNSSPDFKRYLNKNLDSDYLISSVIENSNDDSVSLAGIQLFHVLNPELRSDLLEQIENFRKITVAGISVS